MNENTDLLQPRSASSGDGGTHGSSGEPVAPIPHLVLALSLRFVFILLMGVGLHLAGQSLLWTDLGIIAVDAITLATLAHLMRGEGRRLRDLSTVLSFKFIINYLYHILNLSKKEVTVK